MERDLIVATALSFMLGELGVNTADVIGSERKAAMDKIAGSLPDEDDELAAQYTETAKALLNEAVARIIAKEAAETGD